MTALEAAMLVAIVLTGAAAALIGLAILALGDWKW